MIIDSHAHLVPIQLLADIRTSLAKFPSVSAIEEGGSIAFAFGSSKPTRAVSKPLTDVAARLAWMTSQGIAYQVVGGWVDMFGYELPPIEGEAWSRLINEGLSAAARTEKRFVPLATVPLQDGVRAALVLKDAISIGFSGAMIGTLPRGVGSVLDAEELNPFWAAADEAGAVIHIHPSFDAGDVRVNDYGLANAVGRITDALIAASRLIASGHIKKYAQVKFVVPIGGAMLPFVIGRLKRNYELMPSLGDPVDALHRLYIDTVLHDARVLRFLAEIVGTERLMMGSDMPFPIGDREPTKIVAEAGFKGEQATSINGGFASRLFRIPQGKGDS